MVQIVAGFAQSGNDTRSGFGLDRVRGMCVKWYAYDLFNDWNVGKRCGRDHKVWARIAESELKEQALRTLTQLTKKNRWEIAVLCNSCVMTPPTLFDVITSDINIRLA